MNISSNLKHEWKSTSLPVTNPCPMKTTKNATKRANLILSLAIFATGPVCVDDSGVGYPRGGCGGYKWSYLPLDD